MGYVFVIYYVFSLWIWVIGNYTNMGTGPAVKLFWDKFDLTVIVLSVNSLKYFIMPPFYLIILSSRWSEQQKQKVNGGTLHAY